MASSLTSYAVIQIDDVGSLTNDRFADDPQFIANSYDLSGVAIANDGKWVTMISENVFISANHFSPANGTSVTFYGSNDPSGVSVNRTIQSSQRIGTSDLRIGTLNAGLGGSFGFYDFATQDTTTGTGGGPSSFNGSPYQNADAYIFGRSGTAFVTSQDIAVGRNKLDTFVGPQDIAGTTDVSYASAVNTTGDSNYVQYEAKLQFGDSGGPMMVDTGNGELTVVGINWWIGSINTTEYNGFSYVGNYDAEIQGFIDANPVPEVRSYSLFLGLGALLWIIINNRSFKHGIHTIRPQ